MPRRAPQGLCPRCLIERALAPPDDPTDEAPGLTSGKSASPIGEGAGFELGPYTLLEEIGEGGFGVVYLAEQREPIRRLVALKIIKLGMDTEQVIARFEGERQALAVMDHTNIARIFDAGSTRTGRPYFAMELVRGIPITTFCDANRLTTRDRIGIFLDVCSAVGHAHAKDIIHRDLKPGNILVVSTVGGPLPKVIDFGIAKATSQDLAGDPFQTGAHQLLGSPAYMSPERVLQPGTAADERTDIYSLGVILHELLVGRLPHDPAKFTKLGPAEFLKTIGRRPVRPPSTNLRAADAPTAEAIARSRRATVRGLRKRLRSGLDRVVTKAIHGDPKHRYESPEALALDLRRWLEDRPVLATPPSVSYRARCWVIRHRHSTAAIALVAAFVVAISLLERHRDARRSAELQAFAIEEYDGEMPGALEAFRRGDAARAEVLLEWLSQGETTPDIRGFEWRMLAHMCLRNRLEVWQEHDEAIRDMAMTPDGRALATASLDGITRLRDFEADLVLAEIRSSGQAVAVSPDGAFLATPSPDQEVIVWDIGGGREARRLAMVPAGERVTSLQFAGTELLLVTTDAGKLYSGPIEAGGRPELVDDTIASGVKLAVDPHGHTIATLAAGSASVALRRRDSGMATTATFPAAGQTVRSLGLSPRGKWLAAAGSTPALRVRSTRGGSAVFEWGQGEAAIEHVAFSHDGSHLAASTTAGDLVVFSTSDWTLLSSDPYDGKPSTLCYPPDGDGLYSGTSRGFVLYWSDEPKREPVLGSHPADLCHVEYSRDGRWLAAGSTDGSVTVWNATTRKREHVIGGGGKAVGGRFFAVSPDSSAVAVLRPPGISFHAIASGAEFRSIDHAAPLTAIAFSPDGDLIGEPPQGDGEILLWRRGAIARPERMPPPAPPVPIPERIRTVHRSGASYHTGFSPDQRRLLSAHPGGGIALWNTATWRRVATFPSSCGAFSPDGETLALGEERNIRFLEAPGDVLARWDAYTEFLTE